MERCIRLNKEERPSTKQLLELDFFTEDRGFKLELLNRDLLVSNQETMVKFRLQVTDPEKLKKSSLKVNEAIEFDFNLESDECMEISINMLNKGFLMTDEDARLAGKMMENQVHSLSEERIKNQQKDQEISVKQEPQSQPQVPQESQHQPQEPQFQPQEPQHKPQEIHQPLLSQDQKGQMLENQLFQIFDQQQYQSQEPQGQQQLSYQSQNLPQIPQMESESQPQKTRKISLIPELTNEAKVVFTPPTGTATPNNLDAANSTQVNSGSFVSSTLDSMELQLINTMHNEFKKLKEKIIKLEVTISVQHLELAKHHREVRKLQTENDILRNHVPPEILVQLSNQQIDLIGENSDFNIQISATSNGTS